MLKEQCTAWKVGLKGLTNNTWLGRGGDVLNHVRSVQIKAAVTESADGLYDDKKCKGE